MCHSRQLTIVLIYHHHLIYYNLFSGFCILYSCYRSIVLLSYRAVCSIHYAQGWLSYSGRGTRLLLWNKQPQQWCQSTDRSHTYLTIVNLNNCLYTVSFNTCGGCHTYLWFVPMAVESKGEKSRKFFGCTFAFLPLKAFVYFRSEPTTRVPHIWVYQFP